MTSGGGGPGQVSRGDESRLTHFPPVNRKGVDRFSSRVAVGLRWVCCLLPAALLLPSVGLGFFNDDFVALDRLGSLPLTAWRAIAVPEDFEFFRPLGLLTFRGCLALARANPTVMHGIHLAVFFFAAWLAGVLAGRLIGQEARWWGAALAVAYPGRLETAVWLAALFDLYALVFGTAALVVAAGRWQRPWRSAVLVAALSATAVLYKESALALPLVVVGWQLLGIFPAGGQRVNLLRLSAVAVGSGAAFAARFPVLGSLGGYAGVGLEKWWEGVAGVPELAWRLFFWPGNPFYPASQFVNGLVAGVTVAVLGGWLRRRAGWRLLVAGALLVVGGLLPVLGYVDPTRATYLQSRYLTLAAVGVVLLVVQRTAERPRVWGPLLLLAWTAAAAVNLQPWLEARERREALLDAIEEATRGDGRHLVWVGGELDTWRGAQQLGGRVPLAVRLAWPDRQIGVVSAYDQRHRGEPPCPPAPEKEVVLHSLYLAETRPWLQRGVPASSGCPDAGKAQ